jgi:methionyl-tRNA synthetase
MSDKVSIDDFGKLDVRVGEIKEVEDHPNADKLFVMKVDLGEEENRTIVAGLKGHYEKEELKGKNAIFVSNLQPVKLRGVESNGMILAASNLDKSEVKILTVNGDLEIGSKVS